MVGVKGFSQEKFDKARHFSGAMISDMYGNFKPILKWNPDYIILHIGTNDVFRNRNTANELLDEILA